MHEEIREVMLMADIEIGLVYLDEGQERTLTIKKEIDNMYDNGLVYYQFCKEYLIFSSEELSPKEAEYLGAIISTDEGLNMMFNDGIITDEAHYRLVSQ